MQLSATITLPRGSAPLQVADNDKRLALLCLSEDQNLAASAASGSRWSKHMATAQRLLVAIERRIRSLDSDLRELSEHLDSTREVWHMQLDALRNRIIRLNLHLEFASIALMAAITPASARSAYLLSSVITLHCRKCDAKRHARARTTDS